MLRDEIDEAKRTVTTDAVQMTIGEIANMYSSSELNILPEFQRLFRWSLERKSNFVESILVGIPIPPAFVYEDQDGTWELIDGLQRVSTVLEFMGMLRDPDSDQLRRSTLTKTRYLPSLENVSWRAETADEHSLDKTLQLFFRRARFDFQILKYPSDPKTKFDLFQRLNRGGAYANEQEVRTCSMVLADHELTKKLRETVAREDFKEIFRISEDQRKEQKDLEYIVRMIVHTDRDYSKGRDVQEFLDYAILDIIANGNSGDLLDKVVWSVGILYKLLGRDALIPPEERAKGIAARFSLRALEGIAAGLARNKSRIVKLPKPESFIRKRIKDFWQQSEVAEMSGAGLRGTVRFQKSIPFGSRWFDPDV